MSQAVIHASMAEGKFVQRKSVKTYFSKYLPSEVIKYSFKDVYY